MNQNKNQKQTLFITGAAGYVGGMLADQFSLRDDVKEIVCLDKNPMPDFLKDNKKLFWIKINTSDNDWQKTVKLKNPDVVIHCAWQIREMYGKRDLQWKWNVEGSNNVFDFAFSTSSVKRLIYFSTASSYGAREDNTLEHMFTEDEPFREEEYLYGYEKKTVEENLKKRYENAKSENKNIPKVFVVRPAAIAGPRGRYMFKRFGLQSVLRKGLPMIPVANKIWCRQFIHEDDVCDIVKMFSFDDILGEYEIFNITPNSIVVAKDMAEVMGKKTFRITPFIVRISFAILWNLSRGRIPTSKGGWKFYSFPIVMDGSKITKKYGYQYKHESRSALEKQGGRYSKYIPPEELSTY